MLLLPESHGLLPPVYPQLPAQSRQMLGCSSRCSEVTSTLLWDATAQTEYEPERSQQKKTNTVLPAKSAGKNGLYLYGETTSPDFGRAALTSPSTPQMARGSSVCSHSEFLALESRGKRCPAAPLHGTPGCPCRRMPTVPSSPGPCPQVMLRRGSGGLLGEAAG